MGSVCVSVCVYVCSVCSGISEPKIVILMCTIHAHAIALKWEAYSICILYYLDVESMGLVVIYLHSGVVGCGTT